MRFTFRGSAVHVFDRETGRNLEYGPEPPAAEANPPAAAQAEAPDPPAAAPAPALPEEPAPATEEGVLPDIGDPFADDGP